MAERAVVTSVSPEFLIDRDCRGFTGSGLCSLFAFCKAYLTLTYLPGTRFWTGGNQMRAVDVLVVDDNRAWADAVREVLLRNGLRARVTDDSQTALRLVDRCKPGLLILDINLRGADGLEILRRLREVDESTPVIVASGEDPEVFGDRALHCGASLFLQKPLAARTLLGAVNRVLFGGHADSSLTRSRNGNDGGVR